MAGTLSVSLGSALPSPWEVSPREEHEAHVEAYDVELGRTIKAWLAGAAESEDSARQRRELASRSDSLDMSRL